MRPDERTAARLWDMLVYPRQIAETASSMKFEAYQEDSDRRLATERRLEIIGEAARGVPESFREAHPEIPWRRIVALRNVPIHEYGEV